jgi:predicted O-methyltransferase YrrM
MSPNGSLRSRLILVSLLATTACGQGDDPSARTAPPPAAPPAPSQFPLRTPEPEPDGSAEIDSGPPPRALAPAEAFRFGEDRFSTETAAWKRALARFKGRPNVRYLELGPSDGRSVIWMLENVLTGAKSSAMLMTPPSSPAAAMLKANLEVIKSSPVRWQEGRPLDQLRNTNGRWFNIVFINGLRPAGEALATALQAWDSLAADGVMIFSDQSADGAAEPGLGRRAPREARAGGAADVFVTAHRQELRVLHRGGHVIVRSMQNPCFGQRYDPAANFDPSLCTAVGQYIYNWKAGAFHATTQPLPLSAAERDTLEKLLTSPALGAVDAPAEVGTSEAVRGLLQRIGAKLPSRDAARPAPAPAPAPASSQ